MIANTRPPGATSPPALALPDPATARGTEPERARRAARHTVRAVGVICTLAATCALSLPVERTVELEGRLVPTHVVPVRPLLDGLVVEVLVAPGDTVGPGRLLARLYAPERAAAHPRRAYVAHHDVHTPPTLAAGVVLTEVAAAAAAQEGAPQQVVKPHATDAGWLSQTGTECVVVGAAEPGEAHTGNESVSLAVLSRCYETYRGVTESWGR